MVSDRPTRPPGVIERFRELTADDRNHARRHPELRLRLEVADFVVLSARQRYRDVALDRTADQFWTAWFALREPDQHLTHTDFEDRSIACLRRLHPLIDGYAERHPDADPLDVDDGLRRLFVDVPPQVLLGELGPNSSFDLLCWNAANSVAEGVKRPYFAARPVVHAAYHHPADPFGIVAPLTELAERYEDCPDDRPAIAEEITAVLTRFLEVAPWPLD